MKLQLAFAGLGLALLPSPLAFAETLDGSAAAPEEPAQLASPAADKRRLGPTVGLQVAGYAERTLGLRAMMLGQSEEPGSIPSFSLMERGVAWLSADHLSGRYEDELFVGRSEKDWIFGALIQGSIGLRLPFTPNQGPFARIGARAGIGLEGGLYLSSVSFPVGEVGYQFIRSGEVFDILFHIAPLLVGVAETGQSRVPLGGAAYGLSLGLVLAPIELSTDVTSYEADLSGQVFDARTRACFLTAFRPPEAVRRTGDPRRPLVVGPEARDAKLSICPYGRLTSLASVPSLNAAQSPIFSAGISLSFGTHSLLDPAP